MTFEAVLHVKHGGIATVCWRRPRRRRRNGLEYGRKGFGNVAIAAATLDFVTSATGASTLAGSFAGALGWAGVANLYYWIDRANGYGGFWATQTLPFGDVTGLGSNLEFETALCASLEG